MTRVHRTTVRCTACGDLREGELLHGSLCPRCGIGTLRNVAEIAADEVPRPWDDGEGG